MTDPELENAILTFVGRGDYVPVKPRAIAAGIRLSQDRLPELRKAIKRLVRQGRLAYGSNHHVQPVADEAQAPGHEKPHRAAKGGIRGGGLVQGVFQRTRKGFGFVRPDAQSRAAGPEGAAGETAEAADIYISIKATQDASTGDVVLVQLLRPRGGPGGPSDRRGEIVEIVERQTRQFVGTYFESEGSAYVQVDGTLFAQPIHVGDPGAKGARTDDKVVVEMVRFPSPLHEGEAVILEVLGRQGEPRVDTLSIIREFNLPEEFAEDALAEARQQAEQFDASLAGRFDATAETVVTIDPIDARDFDDAISLERSDGGGWRLGVHIADVAHFVRPRTALDREARQRGTSVYLPDRVLPMLPEIVSNSLASLQPGTVRYTKSVFMEFDAAGIRTHAEYHTAAIQSARRLTYEEVDAFLADREGWRKKLGAKVHALLGRMHELAMLLRGRRVRHGALLMTIPEVKIELDADGRVSGAHVVQDTESHQIIEEFMLAANEAVAEVLAAKAIPFLRRIHQAPSPHKLRALTEFVRELKFPVVSLQDRFELQRLLGDVRGRPEEHAVNYAVLRAMQRAVYSPKEEGHYALASDCYCHFTSPIRRYPDLTVHRLLGDILAGRKPRGDLTELIVLGQHCSDREQRADAAERDLTKLKLLAYLNDRVGLEMEALVTGVESFGLFAQGIELPAEGLIHADALADDYYTFDRATHTLQGRRSGNRYRLGDRLRVVVARVDLARRELDFRLVEFRGRGTLARREAVQGPPRTRVRAKPRVPKKGRTKPRR
jgi:ribonuclease R